MIGIIGIVGLTIWMLSIEYRLLLLEKCDKGLKEAFKLFQKIHSK